MQSGAAREETWGERIWVFLRELGTNSVALSFLLSLFAVVIGGVRAALAGLLFTERWAEVLFYYSVLSAGYALLAVIALAVIQLLLVGGGLTNAVALFGYRRNERYLITKYAAAYVATSLIFLVFLTLATAAMIQIDGRAGVFASGELTFLQVMGFYLDRALNGAFFDLPETMGLSLSSLEPNPDNATFRWVLWAYKSVFLAFVLAPIIDFVARLHVKANTASNPASSA